VCFDCPVPRRMATGSPASLMRLGTLPSFAESRWLLMSRLHVEANPLATDYRDPSVLRPCHVVLGINPLAYITRLRDKCLLCRNHVVCAHPCMQSRGLKNHHLNWPKTKGFWLSGLVLRRPATHRTRSLYLFELNCFGLLPSPMSSIIPNAPQRSHFDRLT
jgi:hypothetical protein